PLLARGEVEAGTVEPGPGRRDGGLVDGGVGPGAGAVVAAPAAGSGGVEGGQAGVVELAAQEGHPAGRGRLVVDHRLLFAVARGGEPFVAFGVVGPLLAGGQ